MKAQDLLLGNKQVKSQPSVEDARKAMFEAGEAPKNYKGGMTSQELQDKKNFAAKQTEQPISARPAVQQRQEEAITGPSEVVALLTYVDGTQEEIIVDTKEDLVKEVDTRYQQLRSAGQATKIQVRYQVRAKTEKPAEPVAVTPNQPAATPSTAKNGVERAETKYFIAEIRQEGGKWVGELTYKNGAGTEKFVANTKNDLTMQMLVGKGNATVKVRKVIREQKLGIELDTAYTFEGLTQEEFDAMPAAGQQKLIDAAASQASILFIREHPEYIASNENWEKIKRFLDKREKPYTYTNLEYAFDELSDEDLLDLRTKKHAVEVAPVVEDSAPVVEEVPVAPAPAPTPTPAPQVRKRGTTGLQPGFSSAGNTELDTPTGEANKPRELSEAELRALPLSEHKKLYRASLKQPNRTY